MKTPHTPLAISVIREVSYSKFKYKRGTFLCGCRGPEVQQFCVCSKLLARAQCWQRPELWTPELNNVCTSQQERCVSVNSVSVDVNDIFFFVSLLNPTSKCHAAVFPSSLLVTKGFHVFYLPNMGENNYLHLKNLKELRTGTDSFQSSCPVSDISSHKARIWCSDNFWTSGKLERENVSVLCLEKTKPWGDFVVAFQYLKGASKKDRDKLFNRVDKE